MDIETFRKIRLVKERKRTHKIMNENMAESTKYGLWAERSVDPAEQEIFYLLSETFKSRAIGYYQMYCELRDWKYKV